MSDATVAARAAACFARRARDLEREDLRQEAEVAVLEALRTFDPNYGVSWGYYAWRACVRKLAGYSARERSARCAPLQDERTCPASAPARVELRECGELLRGSVDAQLAAPVLFGEWRPREVAAEHGVPASRVHRAVHRAKSQLRREE